MEYNKLWSTLTIEQSVKYKKDQVFEDSFINIVGECSSNCDLVWDILSLHKSDSYKVDDLLEKEFVNLSYVNGFLNGDIDEIWSFLTETTNNELNDFDEQLEIVYDELMFDSVFSYFSSKRYFQWNYQFSSEFEEKFDEVSIWSTEFGPSVVVELTKTGRKSDKTMKTKPSQNLKTLLNQRLQRLKLEDETIECIKILAENAYIFKCKICGFEAKRKRRLFMSHIIPNHVKSKPKSKKKSRKSALKSKLSFKSEINKVFFCPSLDCDKTFTARSSRKRHIIVCHGKKGEQVRSEKCVVCQDRFSSKDNLRRHMLQSHRVSKDWKKCPMCSYVTRRADNLARHCVMKHEGKMDSHGYLKCEKCTKVFASPSLLQSHKEKHVAIAIGYQCIFCKRPVSENHKCEFRCEDCQRSFDSMVLYTRHQKIHKKISDIVEFVTNTSDHDELKAQIDKLTF